MANLRPIIAKLSFGAAFGSETGSLPIPSGIDSSCGFDVREFRVGRVGFGVFPGLKSPLVGFLESTLECRVPELTRPIPEIRIAVGSARRILFLESPRGGDEVSCLG